MEQNLIAGQGRVDEIGALIQSLEAKNPWLEGTKVILEKAPPSAAKPADDLVQLNSANIKPGALDPALPVVVIVDKAAHQTHVLQMRDDGRIEDVLKVSNAVGKKSTPTPEKRWEISDKRLDPIWYPPKSIGGDPVRPYKENPRNPIGLAFIRLDGTNYGLHGTNRPDQIGKSVSHGCMRHLNEDILKIYPLVDKGTAVYTVKSLDGSKIRFSDFR